MTNTATSGPGHKVWLADFDRIAEAIRPYVQTFSDGFEGVVGAPDQLLRQYQTLTSVGYYHGWMA